jgi:hypothetical protein
VLVDPTLADLQQCGYVVDGEELKESRVSGIDDGQIARHACSFGLAYLASNRHEYLVAWRESVTGATVSRA